MSDAMPEPRQYVNLLDVMTNGLSLPEGCDRWGFRSVHPDFRSSRGFVWPFPGNWAEASGPIVTDNTYPCPVAIGDGLCLATTWRGAADGGISCAYTLLLCAYSSSDVLGFNDNKLRTRRAFVIKVIDASLLIRSNGARADLRNANLRNADLSNANLHNANLHNADLSNANLSNANLRNADLSNADLSNAYLRNANLSNADLSNADLYGADLSGAYLSNAYLRNANLSNADLSDADLYGADLSGAYLSGAIGVDKS